MNLQQGEFIRHQNLVVSEEINSQKQVLRQLTDMLITKKFRFYRHFVIRKWFNSGSVCTCKLRIIIRSNFVFYFIFKVWWLFQKLSLILCSLWESRRKMAKGYFLARKWWPELDRRIWTFYFLWFHGNKKNGVLRFYKVSIIEHAYSHFNRL